MEERERMFKENAATLSNKILFFIDVAVLVLVSILYGIGKDSSWKISWDNLLITFIIIRSIFIGFRMIHWWIDVNITQVSGYWTLFFFILWVPTMAVYYVIELKNFFQSDNSDWKDNASKLWGAALVITIEGLIFLAIFSVVLIIFSIWILGFVLRSCKNTDAGLENQIEAKNETAIAASHISRN